MRLIDLTGKRFEYLMVLDRATNKGKRAAWHCRCDCGTETVAIGGNLQLGFSKSCGCRRGEANRKRLTTYGRRRTPEYKVWCELIARCENPANRRLKNYGERGIKVHKKWRESFQLLYDDMGDRPSSKHSIDRKDNDKSYDPSNCRWAAHAEQSRNRMDSRLLTANGRTQNLHDWANDLGRSHSTIIGRLKRGRTVESAVTTPPDPKHKRL